MNINNIENLEEEINKMNRFKPIIETIKNLYQNYKEIDSFIDCYNCQDDSEINHNKRTYSMDEVISAVLDFYKQLEPEYYMIVEKIFHEDKIRIYYKDSIDPKRLSSARCNIYDDINPNEIEYLDPDSKLLYDCANYKIFVPLKRTIADFYSLTHELMHAIVWENTQHSKFSATTHMLVETPSRIVENLLDSYLIKQTNNKEEIIQCRLNRLLDTQRDIKYTYFADSLLKLNKTNGEYKLDNLKELLQQTNFVYSDAEISNFFGILKDKKYYLEGASRYIAGDIAALEFLNLFKEDRVIATQRLKNLVQNIGNLTVEQSFALIGVNLSGEPIKSVDKNTGNKSM
ncbi:MAG: hypothetical protein PHS45_00335 [Bacilli bacterium]|nr:hypothetical protein [Bacilli bacterium]